LRETISPAKAQSSQSKLILGGLELSFMKRKIFLMLIIAVFSLSVFGQKDWQKRIEQIKPLFTTEAEVEKIIGKAIDRYSHIGEYETKDGKFDVFYSEGKCLPILMMKYNVEKGVVIQFNFTPNKKIKFAPLGIDISGWKNYGTRDMSPPLTYSNLDKGIEYTVYKGLLTFLQVYPSNNLDYFKCSESSV
jgi:hypothetical protein